MAVTEILIVIATWVCFLTTGVVLAKWDLRERRLPNRYVMVALVGGLTGFALVSVLNQSWGSFQRAVMAAALCVVVFAMIHVFGGMGMGDVKYASVIGLYLGWISWESVYWGVFAAFLLAALAVFICSICRRPQRNIPFGPFMTLGVIYMSAISVI